MSRTRPSFFPIINDHLIYDCPTSGTWVTFHSTEALQSKQCPHFVVLESFRCDGVDDMLRIILGHLCSTSRWIETISLEDVFQAMGSNLRLSYAEWRVVKEAANNDQF